MSPTLAGIVGLVLLFVLIFSKMPVGFLMALLGVVGFAYLVTVDAALNLMAKDLFDVFGSYSLTVIPLFILMGQIAFHSGISSRLFKVAYTFIGHWPGGMAVATLGACTGFSAICGSTNATAATMAAVTLPEMKKYGYRDSLATGVVAAGGSIGILIPPSVIFIVYGIMTEQSIGKLFMAGIVPGILLTGLFILTVVIWATLKPEIAPRGPRATVKEKLASLSGLIETLILVVLVMGGLFFGIFTPTEAGAIGAMGTLIIAVARRNIDWKGFVQALFETTRISCMVLVIVAGGHHFRPLSGHYPDSLRCGRLGHRLQPAVVSRHGPDHRCLSDRRLFHRCPGLYHADGANLLPGRRLHGLRSHLVRASSSSWSPRSGVITPPVGVNVYVVSGVARTVPLEVIFKGVIPLLIALVVGVLIMIPFPRIALLLPQLMH